MLKSELAALVRKIMAELGLTTKCRTTEKESTTMIMTARRISRSNPNNLRRKPMLKTINVHPSDPPHGHKPSILGEPSIDYPNKEFVIPHLSIENRNRVRL